MPHYDYKCRNCEEVFEVYQSIKDDSIERCIVCEDGIVDRVISQFILIDRTPKTFGSLAEKNTHLLGSGERSEREARAKQYAERAPDTSLAKFTPAEQQKYILEGKRPIGK